MQRNAADGLFTKPSKIDQFVWLCPKRPFTLRKFFLQPVDSFPQPLRVMALDKGGYPLIEDCLCCGESPVILLHYVTQTFYRQIVILEIQFCFCAVKDEAGAQLLGRQETGKTKIISLVNTAQPKIIALLTTGQPVVISIKRSKIFVQDQNTQYLGVLPDDIGKRLIKLIKGGNTYTACIKSATEHNVCVFIKETKRTSKYKNQPSFPQTDNLNFGLSKTRTKVKSYKDFTDEDDDRPYSSPGVINTPPCVRILHC